ncbi:Presqualene diphosphate synthase [Commensalibacter sp. Nvir]|uniref:presqualene diphosphate synthase HpnD n=1 Tax=Commensalibacter sp. Nvir TaxID=3069817 RepID=UPI002D46890A|nr:Presqualene diphosphate synthase [Commensalibacter sp. Nvir]
MRKLLTETAQIMGCSEFDLSYVEAIVRGSKTSFVAGMQVLAPECRYSMYALYSFCRNVDDIADEGGDSVDKHRLLQNWRERIARLYEGKAADSVERVLQNAIRRYDLQQKDFIDIIDGMEMDIDNPIVAPNEVTLDLYCDRVASAVGRLAVRIFGDSSKAAQNVAYHLGRALQLTNILRDIEEDALHGRLYLPKELLKRFHLPLDPNACVCSPLIHEVANIVYYRAQDHFRQAKKAISFCDPKAIFPARIMAVSYQFLLFKQKRLGWRPPFKKVSLSKVEKLVLALFSLSFSVFQLKKS